MLQRKEEIFTDLTSEPPKGSSETQDPPVEQRAEKQTQKDDDNESFGTVPSGTQTPVPDPDIEDDRSDQEETGLSPDPECEHEHDFGRERTGELDPDAEAEHRDLLVEVGSLLGSATVHAERLRSYDAPQRAHTCARSLKMYHPEGSARASSPPRRVDLDPRVGHMMEQTVRMYERAMEIKMEEEVGNKTAQHYESCVEDADVTRNVLDVSPMPSQAAVASIVDRGPDRCGTSGVVSCTGKESQRGECHLPCTFTI